MTSSQPAFSYTHTVETDVAARAIWALYDDVSTWPLWDDQAEVVTRDGPAEQAREVGPMITADFPKTMGALIALAARDNQAPKQGA